MTYRIVSAGLLAIALISCSKEGSPTGPEENGNPPGSTGSFSQVGTLQSSTEGIASLAVSPDGTTLAFGVYGENSIRLVNIETRQITKTLNGHTNAVTQVAFSPNSQRLASTGTVNLSPSDGTVRLWDVASGAEVAMVATAPAGTSELRFSPDGSLLLGASGGDPMRVVVWNANTLNAQDTISGVFRMAVFSPDGATIATGKRDNNLYVVNVATGAEVTTYTGHTGWVQSAAYSSNGQMLVTGSDDETIRIWNTQTGQTTRTLTGHTSYPEFVALSADGTTLASLGSGLSITRTGGGITIGFSDADRYVRLWDVNTGDELPQVDIEDDVLICVAFSPDWSVLVTGSNTGLIRFFTKE